MGTDIYHIPGQGVGGGGEAVLEEGCNFKTGHFFLGSKFFPGKKREVVLFYGTVY